MPSSSEKQRKFFGIVLAYKRGLISDKELSKYDNADDIKKAAKSMTEKQIKDFAKRVKESDDVLDIDDLLEDIGGSPSTGLNTPGMGNVVTPNPGQIGSGDTFGDFNDDKLKNKKSKRILSYIEFLKLRNKNK